MLPWRRLGSSSVALFPVSRLHNISTYTTSRCCCCCVGAGVLRPTQKISSPERLQHRRRPTSQPLSPAAHAARTSLHRILQDNTAVDDAPRTSSNESYGEEELAAIPLSPVEADRFAEEIGNLVEESTSHHDDAVDVVRTSTADAASTTTLEQTWSYQPCGVHGLAYTGMIAQQLKLAAARRGFASEVWCVKEKFLEMGCSLTEGCEDEGEEVVLSTGAVIHLFNIEQTNCKSDDLHRFTRLSITTRRGGKIPRGITGRPLSEAIMLRLQQQHAHTMNMYAATPVWITRREAEDLHVLPRPEEEGSWIQVSIPLDEDVRGGVCRTHLVELLNVSQLRCPDRFTEARCFPMRCISIRGRHYNSSTTFLMREFCVKHQLSSHPLALFLTPRAVEMNGGTLMWPPYGVSGRSPHASSSSSSSCESGHPPEFSCLFGSEVVSFVHAECTTNFLQLVRRAKEAMHNNFRSR